MKQKLKALAPIVLLAASSVAVADAWYGISPYAGFDAQLRDGGYRKGFGDNILKRSYPQGNVYVGLRFNDYLGIEVGYEHSKEEFASAAIVEGDSYAGQVQAPPLPGANVYPLVFNTRARIRGPHLDLVGFYPLCNNQTEILAYIGAARLNFVAQSINVLSGGDPVDPPGINSFNKRKTVLRAGAGVQHKVFKHVGIRATVGWENTQTIKAVDKETGIHQIKLKDHILYGFGVYVFT